MSQETEVNESMYADYMDEESIGAMFGHGEATEGEAQPEQAEVPQPEEKPEEAPQEKPEPTSSTGVLRKIPWMSAKKSSGNSAAVISAYFDSSTKGDSTSSSERPPCVKVG